MSGTSRKGGIVLTIVFLAGLAMVMWRRAWMIAREIGAPILSTRTWQEFRLYAVVAGAVILIVVAIPLARYLKNRGAGSQ